MNHSITVFSVVGAIIAGLWGMYTFIYQEQVKESEKTLYLVVEGKLTKVAEKNDLIGILVNLEVTNKSDLKVYLLADYYNTFGITVEPQIMSDEDYHQFVRDKLLKNESYSYLSREMKEKEHNLVFSGKIVDSPDIWWLESEESIALEQIFFVNKKYDYLNMKVVLVYCRYENVLDGRVKLNSENSALEHEIYFSDSIEEEFAGKKFDWNKEKHKAKQREYRNADISHETKIPLKPML